MAVDDNGNFLEYIPKEAGHSGKGRRHLAVAVLLKNSKDQVLLQKRKHRIFNNIWDITGATHPLHKTHSCHSERSEESVSIKIATSPSAPRNDGKCKICNKDNIDETLEETTKRCLRDEWNIGDIGEIRDIGVFNYFAQYGNYCENEHCHLMVGEYDGEVSLNPDMGYEYKWMRKEEFLKDIEQHPQDYTPWAREGIFTLQKPA